MSHRKADHERTGHRTAAELARHEPTGTPATGLTPGAPPRPQFFGDKDKRRKAWLHIESWLTERRLLAKQDGAAVEAWVAAILKGDTSAAQAILNAVWAKRTPFPDARPEKQALTVVEFLGYVRRGRETFKARMRPESAVCFDWSQDGQEFFEYQWAEDDAGGIAREYAQKVDSGGILAGDLVIRAARRFLSDLEHAHERGLYFDPIAARHICRFAELYCGVKLMPWQVFCFANIFGWKRATGFRRFTEAWLSTAKKNGKTRFASIIALWGLIADLEGERVGTDAPEVCSVATAKDQSSIVWNDAKKAVHANPQLKEYVTAHRAQLLIKSTDATFKPLASDEGNLDGPRFSTVICDEVAFWDARELWDTVTKAIVSRDQPLVLAVSTAGRNRALFAFTKFDLASKILRGIIVEDSVFACIFALDEKDAWDNPAIWPKANPSLGITLKEEHLIKMRDEAREDSAGVSAFIQYHCNLWPEVTLFRSGSISNTAWEACDGRELFGKDLTPSQAIEKFLEIQHKHEMPLYLGVDHADKNDLSCIAMLWPFFRVEDGTLIRKRAVVVHSFAPEQGLIEKVRSWRVPLDAWAREEFLTLMPGDEIDTRVLKASLVKLFEDLNVRSAGFDKWFFKQPAAELCELGFPMVEVPQVPSQLTAPAMSLKEAIKHGEVCGFGQPLLKWAMGNVILDFDERHGGIKPTKLSKNEKIDPVAAILNAWQRYQAQPITDVDLGERPAISFI